MKVLFLDVEGTLINSEQAGENPKAIEGVSQALDFHLSRGYELIGISSQGLQPLHKRVDDEVLQMMQTVKMFLQLSCIYVAPGVGDTVIEMTATNSGQSLTTNKVRKPDNIKSFIKPETGLIQYALQSRGRKESIWLIGDGTLDRHQAYKAGIEFLDASTWHAIFSGNSAQVELTQEQAKFLEGATLAKEN